MTTLNNSINQHQIDSVVHPGEDQLVWNEEVLAFSLAPGRLDERASLRRHHRSVDVACSIHGHAFQIRAVGVRGDRAVNQVFHDPDLRLPTRMPVIQPGFCEFLNRDSESAT